MDCKTLEFLAGDGDFDGKGRERGLDITLRKAGGASSGRGIYDRQSLYNASEIILTSRCDFCYTRQF